MSKSINLDPSAVSVRLGYATSRLDSSPRNKGGTLAQLIDALHHTVGAKDGSAFMQGELVDGAQRSAKNVRANYLLMGDIDGGMSWQELETAIRRSGYFAVVWTTHSHMKTSTLVLESALVDWAKKAQVDISDDLRSVIGRFLHEKRGYVATTQVFSIVRQHLEGGLHYLVQHSPIERYRVMFVLERPWSFSEGGTQEQRIKEWKQFYRNVCTNVGLPFDVSCTDPARLMYTPRVPDAAALEHAFVRVIDGRALPHDVTGPGPSDGLSTPDSTASATLQRAFATRNILQFVGRFGNRFRAASWLEEAAPEDVRGNASDGAKSFACPNEDAHSHPSRDDTAFYARDAGASFEYEGFSMGCLHASCKAASGGDRLFFLDKACQNYGVTDAMDLVAYCDDVESDGEAPSEEPRRGSTDAGLEVTGDGSPLKTRTNVELALRHAGIRLEFDEFASRAKIDGLPEFGPDLDDAVIRRCFFFLQEQYGLKLSKEFLTDALLDTAQGHKVHPVRLYLANVEPTWDGVKRVERLFIDYCGADDTELNRAMACYLMIGLVRRVRMPGVKADEIVVLEGDQGAGKSRFLAALAGRPEWFCDNLSIGADPKEVIEQTQGKWLVELQELSGMGKAEVENVKSFASRSSDRARMSYARLPQEFARQFLCVGTTNSDRYLRDLTGNRRFLPVKVKNINVPAVLKDRDQLCAEAAHMETAGVSHRLPHNLWQAAREVVAERVVDTGFVDVLEELLAGKRGRIRISCIYLSLDLKPGAQRSASHAAIKKAMEDLGWTKGKFRFGAATLTGFSNEEAGDKPVILVVKRAEFGGHWIVVEDKNGDGLFPPGARV